MSAPDMPSNVTVATCVFLVVGLVGYLAHLLVPVLTRPDPEKPCVEESWDPHGRFGVVCAHPKQKLVTPPGWSWVKCECPEGAK